MLATAGPEEIPEPVLTMGPGSIGSFTGSADGKLLRFKPAAGRSLPEIDFARVDMPSGDVIFLATTECSVGQFAGLVSMGDSGTANPTRGRIQTILPYERPSTRAAILGMGRTQG